MKRWIALMMAVLLAVLCCGAYAQTLAGGETVVEAPRGPELPSSFEVVEEEGLSEAQSNPERTQATMGTDVYLFVDPASASYVTFYVYDEWDQPLANATIEISYNGVRAIYGVTDENGLCSVYLFRNVEYEYHVNCYHYEHKGGFFTPTEDTKRVEVRLRRHHDFTVIVNKDGVPVPNTPVWIDGKRFVTDEHGRVETWVYTGTHTVKVMTSNGRYITRKVYVDWDIFVVIDLAEYVTSRPEEPYGEDFLVYNKVYDPEDYVMTLLSRRALDVLKLSGETDEAYRQRTQEYLQQYPSTVLVQAQPERMQLAPGKDQDVINADGTPRYAQRSMMPTGSLLREWEEQAYQTVIFTNEEIGIRFELADLHGEDMTKAFALADALARDGSAQAVLAQEAQLEVDDPSCINAAQLDLSLIRPFEFVFDHLAEPAGVQNRASHELLNDDLYESTLFEFRITPIERENIIAGLEAASQKQPQPTGQVIVLANEAFDRQQAQRRMADGLLTGEESGALLDCFGTQDVQAAVDGKMYRISCWIIHEGVEMDVTSLIDSLQVLWNAQDAYKALLKAHHSDEAAALTALDDRQMQAMDYAGSLDVYTQDMQAKRTMPAKDEDFFSALSRKRYTQLTVDVRLVADSHRSYTADAAAMQPDEVYLQADAQQAAVVWLAPATEAE